MVFEWTEFDAEDGFDFVDVFDDGFEFRLFFGEHLEGLAVEIFSSVNQIAFQVYVETLDGFEVSEFLRLAKGTASSDEFWWNAERVECACKGNGSWKGDLSNAAGVTEQANMEHAFAACRNMLCHLVDEWSEDFDRSLVWLGEDRVNLFDLVDFFG